MAAGFRPSRRAAAFFAATLFTATAVGREVAVHAPIECTRGPGGQRWSAVVSVPAEHPAGGRFAVRIDSAPSGTLAHIGLNYITDMTTDWQVGPGARVVDGSVRVVPDTGTPNVRPGARAWSDASGVHLALPGRVENGEGYTPPSVELEVEVTAAPGGAVTVLFDRQAVTANAIVVGDVRTVCTPRPRPFVIGTTRVVAPGR
jgi:hypothetical protein